MCNIPVISLGNSSTKVIYNKDISKIEQLEVISDEEKYEWLNHLSYSQFTKEELKSGFAWDIVSNLPIPLSEYGPNHGDILL